jgi:hypothetical protein
MHHCGNFPAAFFACEQTIKSLLAHGVRPVRAFDLVAQSSMLIRAI